MNHPPCTPFHRIHTLLIKWVVCAAILGGLATVQEVQAQKPRLWQKLRLDSLANRNLKFLPLPSISVSPESGLRMGFVIDYFYRTKAKDSITPRPSFSWVQALYSTRKQLTIEAFTSTFTQGEKYYILARAGIISDYERYWGVAGGPPLPNNAYSELTYQRQYAQAKLGRRIGNRFFAGITGQYSNYQNISNNALELGRTPDSALIPSRIGGLGLYFAADHRNNQFSPTEGYFVDVTIANQYRLPTGGLFYTTVQVDLRNYHSWGKSVLAEQLVVMSSSEAMPVLEQWRLGGANVLRGVFQGRYRGNSLAALQAEYRYALSKNIRWAAFASAGTVAAGANPLNGIPLQWSGGTGLRLLINKDKQIFVRGDVALASNGQFGYYFRIGDAF